MSHTNLTASDIDALRRTTHCTSREKISRSWHKLANESFGGEEEEKEEKGKRQKEEEEVMSKLSINSLYLFKLKI